jgi:hypothetical protein
MTRVPNGLIQPAERREVETARDERSGFRNEIIGAQA